MFCVRWDEIEHLAIEHLAIEHLVRRVRSAAIVSDEANRFGRRGMGALALVAHKVERLATRRVRCGGPPFFVGTLHRVIRLWRVYHHGIAKNEGLDEPQQFRFRAYLKNSAIRRSRSFVVHDSC